MKIYVTKFALTKGILEKEAEICSTVNEKMIKVDSKYPEYLHKPFWHTSKEDAIVHAEILRENELKSLEKRIEKLKKIKF